MAYEVTGEYITVKTETANGPRVVGLLKGARVPSDVSEESIAHHLRVGLIAEVDDVDAEVDDAPVEPPADKPVEPPVKSATKADWKAYVMEHKGVSEADAEAATRDQLADQYGS